MATGWEATHFWSRTGIVLAVVTTGFAQVAFNLIITNLEYFPRELTFFLWTLFWIQLVPFVILFLLDGFISRSLPVAIFQAWRSLLCTFLLVSFVRQFEILKIQSFDNYIYPVRTILLYFAVSTACFVFCFRFRRFMQPFVSYFGLISSIILISVFLYRIDLLQLIQGQDKGMEAKSSSASSSSISAPSIFIIVFDELSYDYLIQDGKLDRERYPNFATLASESIWFTNATSNHWLTEESIPTIVTGRLVPDKGSSTFFELLPEGYTSTLIVTDIWLENWFRKRPSRSYIDRWTGKGRFVTQDPIYNARFIMNTAYSYFFGFIDKDELETGNAVYHLTFLEEMKSFFEGVDNTSDGPQFCLWMMSIPHSPFMFQRDGSVLHDDTTYFPLQEHSAQHYNKIIENYREQLRFVDVVLGRLLQHLKKAKLYERSIIVITSDHGLRVWSDLLPHVGVTSRIPLILHAPTLQPMVNDIDFQLIDLVPTLLDILSIQYDSRKYDGISIFSQKPRERAKLVRFSEQDFILNEQTGVWDRVLTNDPKKSDGKLPTLKGRMLSTATKTSKSRGFLATEVIDDLYTAKENHEDFLTRYITQHFPNEIADSELESISNQLHALKKTANSPRKSFKSGMLHFFLAIAGTRKIANRLDEDSNKVSNHWKSALYEFSQAADIGSMMAEELRKIIEAADANDDNSLDSLELTSILKRRTP